MATHCDIEDLGSEVRVSFELGLDAIGLDVELEEQRFVVVTTRDKTRRIALGVQVGQILVCWALFG